MRRFALKTGMHFAHFGLESGMVFEGTTECMNVNGLNNFFCLRSKLGNDNIISAERAGLKTGMDFRGLV